MNLGVMVYTHKARMLNYIYVLIKNVLYKVNLIVKGNMRVGSDIKQFFLKTNKFNKLNS